MFQIIYFSYTLCITILGQNNNYKLGYESSIYLYEQSKKTYLNQTNVSSSYLISYQLKKKTINDYLNKYGLTIFFMHNLNLIFLYHKIKMYLFM